MKKQLLIIITLALLKFKLVTCVPSTSLTTMPTPLSGGICHTTVQMTCMITDLTSLRWFIDDMAHYEYVYSRDDESKLPITLSAALSIPPGLDITITSVTPNNNPDHFNAISSLTTNVSLLQAFNMEDFTCGSFDTMSEPVTLNFHILGPPLTPVATCSLVTSAGGMNISLQWSSSFNSQHAVERYRVSVDPDPFSFCSSDQVMPSEDYSCPGLSPERNYSITVSAINCGDQEGESNTFTVLPQLLGPQSPGGALVIPDPNIGRRLTVIWIESITTSRNCLFSGVINYTLILEDSAGEVVEERVVSSDSSCSNGSCSSSFSPSSQICRISIIANNTFGKSNPAIAIIVPERLTTSNQVLLAVGVVLLCITIGVWILILLMLKRKTKFKDTPTVSLVTLVVGVVLIVVSVVVWVTVGFQVGLQDSKEKEQEKKGKRQKQSEEKKGKGKRQKVEKSAAKRTPKGKSKGSIISVGSTPVKECSTQQPHQDPGGSTQCSSTPGRSTRQSQQALYTCDSTWQLTRNNLIISAFIFSLCTTILILMFTSVMLICDTIKSFKIKQKNCNEHGETELESYTRGPGGRVAELESALYDEHKYKATSTDTRLKIHEEEFKEYDLKVPESPLYSRTKQPNNTAKQQMPTLEPAIYSHLDTGGGKEEEADKEYASLIHWKTETGGASVDVQPELYGKLSTHHLPLCVSMSRYAERRNPRPLPEQVAAWFPQDRKWPIDDLSEDIRLKVYFMNKCPSEWKYCKKKISREVIMRMLQESWRDCFVPKNAKNKSQIRVQFQDKSDGNWSAIGCEAKLIDPPKPTIILNFSNMNDDETKATVLHQFGHALGLGHALMEPKDWKALKPYVHIDSMMKSYCVSKMKDFKVQWTGNNLKQRVVNYDEESVMGYSFDPIWQKVDFSRLPDNVKNLTLHRRQTDLSIKDESILKIIKLAPPMYTFDCDSITAMANDSIKIGFTVTSEHPMPSNPKHTIIREDGGAVRCKIEENCIIFSKLDVRDSGKYTISCYNENMCEGKETFELKVTSVPPKYSMKDDYAEAIAGESAVVHFSATIEPRIHTVTRIDSGKEEDVSSQFIIKKDTITLCNAKVTDSGLYKISCCDDNGVKGEKTFTLKIKHDFYTLNSANVEAKTGESPQLKFSVESRFPVSTRHTVTRIDAKKNTKKDRSNLFKIERDIITFPDVKVSDTGTYAISCRNSDGVQGEGTFKLNIQAQNACKTS